MSLLIQSRSLPGRLPPPKTSLRLRINCRAFRAASRASMAVIPLFTIIRAFLGFSSRYLVKAAWKDVAIADSTSRLPSFVFVCPSNWGWATRVEITTVIPSRTSSPEGASLASLIIFSLTPYVLRTRVNALRKPVSCVPPSWVWILLT